MRGEGDVCVVLNDGIGCEGFVWRYLQPHLAERCRVLHPHYRGHGRSGPPLDRSNLTIGALADDLKRILDAESVERAILIGHSMGTQVNLETWRLAPDRVAGNGCSSAEAGDASPTPSTDRTCSVRSSRSCGSGRASTEALPARLWGRIPASVAYRVARLSGEVDAVTIREEDFKNYWDHIAVMDPDVFLQLLEAAGEHSAEDVLESIDVPSLVIAAERDTFTPSELAEQMAEKIGCDLFMIRGGSHAAPVEQPMTVQLRVDKYLHAHFQI